MKRFLVGMDKQPGCRVILARVNHPDFVGKLATVKRIIKSRQVVEVRLDDGTRYDAFPCNLDGAQP